MPLYEYKCQDCGEVIERIQKFSDDPLTDCPTCEGGTLKRLLSPPAIQFKGSGWYVTDYAKSGSNGKSESKSGGSPSESKETKKSDSKSTSKSDSKPASKSSD